MYTRGSHQGTKVKKEKGKIKTKADKILHDPRTRHELDTIFMGLD